MMVIMRGTRLADALDQLTAEGELYEKLDDQIDAYYLTPEGRCPRCQTSIPGIWWPSEEARRQGASAFAHRIARVF
jgi:hypothetical protein